MHCVVVHLSNPSLACHLSTGHANEAARQTWRSCSEHRWAAHQDGVKQDADEGTIRHKHRVCLHSELLSAQPFVIMWGFLCCNFCLCCAIMKWPRLLFAAGNWKENVIHLWLWTDSALGGKMHFTNDFLNSVLNKKVIDSTKWRKNVLRINSLLFVDEYSFLQSKVLNSAEWC